MKEKKDTAVAKAPSVLKKREVAAHAVAGVGQNLVFGLWSSYMLLFYTDVFGITAAAAGIIMLIARIFDAVNDPLSGIIADRTRTRWGRFRPYFLFMSPIIVVLIVLCFSSPALSPGGKVAYAAITYILMSTAYDFVDVPYWTLPAVMTDDVTKRTRLYGNARIFTSLATAVVAIIAIPLVDALGGGDMKKGFFMIALILGIVAAIMYLIGFTFIREHVPAPEKKEKFNLKDIFRAIFQNKPLLIILLAMIIALTASNIRSSLIVYYVQYNLHARNMIPLFSFAALPGILLAGVLAPVISKKIGQKTTFIASCTFGFIIYLILYFVGYRDPKLVLILSFISILPMGFNLVLCSAMIANTIEYAEWKTGQRSEGLISSTQTFIAKLCMALGAGASGLVLTMGKYVPNVEQATSTLDTIHVSITLGVAFIMLIAIVPMLFNNFTEKRHAEIVAELEQRKKNAEAE